MKKVLALVVCVAMFACFALTASAADEATLTVATVEGKKGDVVAVDVSISAESNIGALEVTLAVDETLLKAVTTKDKRGNDVYFQAGAAATAAGALVEGSEGIVDGKFMLTTATSAGYWDGGVIWTVYFEVLADLEAPAAIDAEVTSVGHYEDDTKVITVNVVDGAVKAPKAADDNKDDKDDKDDKEDKEQDVTNTNPPTGDVSGIAVAAGLCAVMAAAFVITKKVND